jgi:superfamily II helicase
VGYGDILIETPERIGIVIELKYAENNKLAEHCAQALEQIEQNQYATRLIEDGMESIVKYGIAFYKKGCKVVNGNP